MNAPVTTAPAPAALSLPGFVQHATPATDIGFPKSFLIYGDTGTHKTTEIAELVKAGIFNRAVIIDVDNGIETLMSDPEIAALIFDPVTNPQGRIIVMTFDPILDPAAFINIDATICEMAGAYHPLDGAGRPVYTKFITHPDAPKFDVDLLSLDTLNVFQQIAVKHFMTYTVNQHGKPDTQSAWGEVGVYTDAIARIFQNTDRFVGALVAHPRTDTENTGKVSIKPKLQGGTKDSISTIPSLVAHLGFEPNPDGTGTTLVATVGESDVYDAKNRYRLDTKIRDFNLVALYQTIAEKIGKPLPNHNPAPAPAAA
jgi:hypothetical protein